MFSQHETLAAWSPSLQLIACWRSWSWLSRSKAQHALFVYRWPTTGYRVQGFASEDVVEDHHVYEPVTCLACRQIHHVNPTTGAVLGKKAK